MLKQKINANETVILKLLTGEEAIGRFVSEEDNNIVLSKMFAITMQIDPSTNKPALGMMPFMMVSDPMGQTVLKQSHIVVMQAPPKDHPIVAEYQRATSPIIQ